jgi:hypothetical protein
MRFHVPALVAIALLAAGCKGSSTSPTTDTTPVAAPTVSEDFSGTLAVGGSRFFSFTVGTRGTVNLTLNSIGGTGVPSTIQVGLAIGSPSGTACSTGTPTTVAAGTAVQVTATEAAGVFCADISDIGNLASPATFDITIAHP